MYIIYITKQAHIEENLGTLDTTPKADGRVVEKDWRGSGVALERQWRLTNGNKRKLDTN